MNQKIVVAISIIAIVLSLINLATLFLPKSANGGINLSFSSTPQNLYVANMTYYSLDNSNDYGAYRLCVVNPTNETHLFTFAIALIGLPQRTTLSNSTVEFQSFFSNGDRWVTGQNAYPILPHETLYVWVQLEKIYAPKVRIRLLDEFEGFVFSETLDVIKRP